MKTSQEYIQDMLKINRQLYLLGKKIENFTQDPILRPSLNTLAKTYAIAYDPQYSHLFVRPGEIGTEVNLFTSLHHSREDLINKVKALRLLGQQTGACFQRCVGWDALNTLESVTFEIDKDLGSTYHQRFMDYLRLVQSNDLVCNGAMTDVKGDRSLPPSGQKDTDLYLNIIERRRDGIIVRGAKAHQTGAVFAHEIIVMPTLSLREADKDYAVCFAIPSNSPGVIYILGRQASDTRRYEDSPLDVGNPSYGSHEALVIFNDVFVPTERIFMDGEWQYSRILVERFAGYHRQSYGGCKAGVGDVLIGAAALAAENAGVAGASHIKHKLAEMVHLNETIYSCGLACSTSGQPLASGTYLVDLLLANVCKQNVTRFPYEIARLAEDMAGGLMVTLPSQKDLENDEIGGFLEKYLHGVEGIPTIDRLRILRLIENLTLGPGAAAYRTESMHGAGSPEAQVIMINRLCNLEEKKDFARKLAGVNIK
jgi:4-hydroxybutyryl-CoA dehydratase/vinylacetyl-CoA-Delta-isomerase